MSGQASEGIKQFFNLIWLAIVGGGFAVYMGWMDVPKPILSAWDKINGDNQDEFAKLSAAMPPSQAAFIKVVSDARLAYDAASNDMARGALRPLRREQICQSVKDSTNGEWVGLVSDLSSNGDGLGVLSIKIAPHVTVGTWNNDLSDIGSNTLLKPGDPVHTTAVALKKGDAVKFTGTFFPNDTDCIREKSVTLDGSMSDPDFSVRFQSLSRL